ncbi:MAG: class I SAM-dependent methyltransferase [Dehalococcoidia bacterium]
MPNERQFKLRTKFVATRNVAEYRATIPVWVTPDDVILEVGCEWGTTTTLLAQACEDVIGTDVSAECIERARAKHPDLRFEVLDVFNLRAAQALGETFSKIYIDVSGFSGYRSLLDVIAMLTMYATVFEPEAIVVKSGALKHFAGLCVPWREGMAQAAQSSP